MTLAESYSHCRAVAKARAKNFYYSFILLDSERKDAMCAIYAFMRYCDDLSDEPGATKAAMERWREALVNALAGNPDGNPTWPAFLDTVARYRIPHEYFFDMIDGVASDLEPREIATFDDLYAYCYRVASVVGLTTIYIFGFTSPEALPLAEKCGIAFQLTNILRDVKEDREQNRVYIPAEDLQRFGADFGALMDFEIARAQSFYDESRPLLRLILPETRPALWAMIEIYESLLHRIAENPYEVERRRVSVPLSDKLLVLLRAKLRRLA